MGRMSLAWILRREGQPALTPPFGIEVDGARLAPAQGYNPLVGRIYLDHNATTPLDPRVLDAMLPVLREGFGNPSSLHWFGQQARAAVDGARERVAALVGASPGEIVFTGSGTEADNMALRGAAAAAREPRRKVVYSAIEHHAVMNTAKALAEEGVPVESARVGVDGRVDLDDLRAKVDDRTAIVALMLANNETGIVEPLEALVRIARARGALVHCDAVQAAGKIPVDARALDVDTLAVSAHKIYGPKGVGALYVKRGTRLKSFVRGGSQERNRRAGTENVAGIVGLGRAAELAREEMLAEAGRLTDLRDRLEARLLAIPGAQRNGEGPRVPNTTNVSFAGVEAESLVMALDLAGLAVSTGAACAAGAVEPSHVLRAMGLPLERVQGSLRFSLGRGTTAEHVDRAAPLVAEAVERQRKTSRTYAGKA
jgi:cysteine desulfurase